MTRNQRLTILAVICLVLVGLVLKVNGVGGVNIDPTNTTYSRDSRTDICFVNGGTATSRLKGPTYVPCTLEVLALVPKSQGGGM